MATKKTYSVAVKTKDGDSFTFSDGYAVYDQLKRKHLVKGVDSNNKEVEIPFWSVDSATVTESTSTVDMTDNFCKEGDEPVGNCLFTLPIGDVTYCVTEDMWECNSGEWGAQGYFAIPNAQLVDGSVYSLTYKGETQTKTFESGQMEFYFEDDGQVFNFSNDENAVWVGWYGGNDCDSAKATIVSTLTENPIDIEECKSLFSFEALLYGDVQETVTVTECHADCKQVGSSYVGTFVIPSTRLLAGTDYIFTRNGQTERVTISESFPRTTSLFDGAVTIEEAEVDYSDTTTISFNEITASSCEGAKTAVVNAMEQNPIEIVCCGRAVINILYFTKCDIECNGTAPNFYATADGTGGCEALHTYNYSYTIDGENYIEGTATATANHELTIPDGNGNPFITIVSTGGGEEDTGTIGFYNNSRTFATCDGAIADFYTIISSLYLGY